MGLISKTKLNKYNKDLENNRGPAIVVLCGSFNPITYQHLRIAELAKSLLVRNQYQVLGGYISPVSDYYEKATLLRGQDHRINMCKIAIKESDWIMIDEYEYYKKRAVPTIEVLNSIKRRLLDQCQDYISSTNISVAMVAGSDLLESMKNTVIWPREEVEDILKHYTMVVISRDNTSVKSLIESYDLFTRYSSKIMVAENGFRYDISSTYIRESMKKQQSIKYLTNNEIIKYIEYFKLFQ